MKIRRVAIFAHYDRQSLIDDYVVLYLENLREVVDNIIFVSDCDIEEIEMTKVSHLLLDSICSRHDEYDFGSYKRGFFLLKEKYSPIFNLMDELIFVNDSCYLVAGFREVFQKMEVKDCDFWGLTQNKCKYPEHIQSYFLAFRRQVFDSKCFIDFLNTIKKEQSKEDIIRNYEIGITNVLTANGFRKDSFIEKIYDNNPLCSDVFFKEIMPQKMPLIKVEMMIKNPCVVHCVSRKIRRNVDKRVFSLIKKHEARIGKKLIGLDNNSYYITLINKSKLIKIKFTTSENLLIKFLKIPIYHRKIVRKVPDVDVVRVMSDASF